MPQAAQGRERLAPGGESGGGRPGGVLRVGEIAERRRLERAVTQLGEQAMREPVAGGGVGETAEPLLGKADRRPGMRSP